MVILTINCNIPTHASFSVSHFVFGQQPLANLKQDYLRGLCAIYVSKY